jgi:hypothetical protein
VAHALVAAVLGLTLTTVAAPAAAQRLSEKATVAQNVAGTLVTVEYSRPVARGRDSIFGKVVTWGEQWTPGADWATTVEVDRDVRVEGRLLPTGKYSLWMKVRPDTWTVTFHRQWRVFHVNRPDTADAALRLVVRPDSGAATEVLTFDFPEMETGATTLRFRWGTVVVPLRISAIPPPLELLPSRAARARYLGRYDLTVLIDNPQVTLRRRMVEIVEAGDTLRWRDGSGPEAERREFVLSPAGEDEFRRARRSRDGGYWPEPGRIVSFTVTDDRASGFEVELEDGSIGARAERVR